MARARSLKPAFFKNAELVELPPLTRLLFAGLWTIADREGRLEDRPKHIKLDLLPGDNCDIESMLAELDGFGFILRYEVGGKKVISIPAFHKHQKPHIKEVPSALPPPPPLGRGQQQPKPGKVVVGTEKVVASPSLTLNPIPYSLNPEPLTGNPEPETDPCVSDLPFESPIEAVVVSESEAMWSELKQIYWKAGKTWAPKQDQVLLQRFISLGADGQEKLLNYVKLRLLDGSWRDPQYTKSLANLLSDGDFEAPQIQRTLPTARGQTKGEQSHSRAAQMFIQSRANRGGA